MESPFYLNNYSYDTLEEKFEQRRKNCIYCAEYDHTSHFVLSIIKEDIVTGRTADLQRLATQVLYMPVLVDVEIIGGWKAEGSGEGKLCVESVTTLRLCSEGCKFNLSHSPAVTWCLSCLSNSIIILTHKSDVMTNMALVCCLVHVLMNQG